MYRVKTKTVTFKMNDDDDRRQYDEILNNPLCLITREIKEKLKTTTHEGELTTTNDEIILIVTWQEKTLF